MRHIAIVAVAFGMLSLLGCAAFEPRVRTLVLPTNGIAAPYDFDGVRTALSERGVILHVPTAAEAAHAMPAPAYVPILRQQLTTQPEAEIVSIHLLVADKDSDMLQLDRVLAYAVATTGHDTGNCIPFTTPRPHWRSWAPASSPNEPAHSPRRHAASHGPRSMAWSHDGPAAHRPLSVRAAPQRGR